MSNSRLIKLLIAVFALTAIASSNHVSQKALILAENPQIPIGNDPIPADEILDHVRAILNEAVKSIQPVIDFVAAHPWILIVVLIPAFEAWIAVLGFGANGIVAGSIAAALQSYIGNVPKGSMFAFLQSKGAGGFAATAVRLGGIVLVLAVVVVVVGILLSEKGIGGKDVTAAMSTAWKGIEANWTMPHIPHVPSHGDAVALLEEGGTWMAVGFAGFAAVISGLA